MKQRAAFAGAFLAIIGMAAFAFAWWKWPQKYGSSYEAEAVRIARYERIDRGRNTCLAAGALSAAVGFGLLASSAVGMRRENP